MTAPRIGDLFIATKKRNETFIIPLSSEMNEDNTYNYSNRAVFLYIGDYFDIAGCRMYSFILFDCFRVSSYFENHNFTFMQMNHESRLTLLSSILKEKGNLKMSESLQNEYHEYIYQADGLAGKSFYDYEIFSTFNHIHQVRTVKQLMDYIQGPYLPDREHCFNDSYFNDLRNTISMLLSISSSFPSMFTNDTIKNPLE